MRMMGNSLSDLTSNKTSAYCIGLILLGLVGALGATIWEHNVPELTYGWELTRKVLDHLAIALISIGLIAILIEFRDWREYFQQRIAETIIQQAYLRRLDRDELIALQTNTLKAFFKVEDLDRKGSFLEFFHSRLHRYIASPYREDVDYQFAISETKDDTDHWQIDEISSYKCRAVGTLIPDHVQWTADTEPTVVCQEVVFTLVFPRNISEALEFKERFPAIQESRLIFKSTEDPCKLVALTGRDNAYFGYKLSLDEYRHIDGLGIRVHSKYKMRKGLPLAWGMTDPTRRFSITLSYPADYRAVVNWFGFDDESVEEEEGNPGLYNLRYDSWLLPDSGVSIDLVGGNFAGARPSSLRQ